MRDEHTTQAAACLVGLDARSVARRLAVLPERFMRMARLAEIVEAADPPDAAWLLDTLATAGRAGGPPFDVSLLAAVDLFGGDRLPYPCRQAIFEAAEARGLAACLDLMLSQSQVEDEQAGAPRPLVPGTRPLTLGERKSLARSWDRTVLERLLADPHADVVRLLLSNPHVTEDDILRIATARGSSAAVLGLVLRSRRWGTAPRVRRALVRNPRLPLATALRLLGLLGRRDLEELRRDPHLPPRLAAALKRRLRPPS
ncbi:MAG: hypothetical protein H6712_20975 [Myxococcales bacterium]|nr:hypothetical protein [Myxococcales bacterium]MCB9716348.1 hypothetical protein [Myxococcales bacterium]